MRWSNGQLRIRMYLFLRKDTAARIWHLGVGDGRVMDPLARASAKPLQRKLAGSYAAYHFRQSW